MTSIPLSAIAATVAAARVQGPPTQRTEPGGVTARVLTLRGQRPGELYDFRLDAGHRLWCLDSVADDQGVELASRTLGRRLSARLNTLHAQAREHFTERPTAP